MYCTLEDLKSRIPEDVLAELTDDTGAGAVNAERIDAAIKDATDEVNGYCQARYPVPFSPAPGYVKKLTMDIALYNLFSARGYDEDSTDKSIIDRYRAAVRSLENIAKGVITLGEPAPPPASDGTDIEHPPRVFSRDKLEGF